MKSLARFLLLGLFLVSLETPLSATTIRKKNGDVVDGQIRGTILLKERGAAVFYCAIDGKDVLGIDQDGVHAVAGKALSVLGLEVKNPAEVLEAIQWLRDRRIRSKSLLLKDLPSGGQALGSYTGFEKPCPQKNQELLGEFRVDKKKRKIEVIPAVEVDTANGVVTIPVNEVVEFGTDAERPVAKPQARQQLLPGSASRTVEYLTPSGRIAKF